MNKLDVKGFGLAWGELCGVGCLILAWVAMLFDYGTEYINLVGTFYFGYAATFVGGIIGLIWGFIDGFIGGAIFAWLYNKFAK